MSEEQNTKKNFSVKQFFKSTAFKCIAVLVVIVLVCGVLLTICNALFRVTDEEKLDRVLGSIYPDGNVEEIVYDKNHPTELETKFNKGAVDQVYLMNDGNYLIHAYGTEGYGGNVYMWVVVEMSDGVVSGIGKTQLDKNSTTGETFLDKIPDAAFDFYSENYVDGENFNVQDIKDDQLTGGATASMTGATNAVNTALTFVRTQILDEEEPEPEPVNPFAEFEYIQYIDGQKTKVELAENGTDVVFNIVAVPYTFTGEFKLSVTVNAEGVITAMTVPATPAEGNGSTMGFETSMDPDVLNGTLYIGKNAQQILALLGGADKDSFTYEDLVTVPSDQASSDTITSGATYSNFIVTYSALFAASNYDKGYEMALENAVVYTQYIDMGKTTIETSGENVIFNIVAVPYTFTGEFKLSITVNAEGVITAMNVPATPAEGNGSTMGFETSMDPDVLNGTLYIGKNAQQILALLGGADKDSFTYEDLVTVPSDQASSDTITSGATYSNFIVTYSALFAASNYETFPALMEYKQQQLNAQMSEIYGEEITVEAIDISSFTATAETGTVNAVYKVAGTNDYIVNATGNGGWSSGSVTTWVIVETTNGALSGIRSVAIDSNVGQTFMDKITADDLKWFTDNFSADKDFVAKDYTDNTVETSASAPYTRTAITNSVNVAKNFVAANLLTGGTVA